MLEEMWAEQWADYFHIVWGCPVIQSYWQEVTQAVHKIFADLFVLEKYLFIRISLAANKKAGA